MNEWIIGCDIGSSSIKVLRVSRDGQHKLSRRIYKRTPIDTADLWETFSEAFTECISGIACGQIKAIALTGQIGSYLLFDRENPSETINMHSWQQSDTKTELDELLRRFDRDFFIREISIPHPLLQSYPVPFIMSRKKHSPIGQNQLLLSPKDYLFYRLTGSFISDPYTWRGLCDKDGHYSRKLLEYTELSESQLPQINPFGDAVCGVLPSAACALGIKQQTPVYLGCNDFFAALLGSGSLREDIYFDVTGTSEHYGIITKNTDCNSLVISSPFLDANVCYGVTASSGNALFWAKKQFGREVSDSSRDLPIFLPYLNGERTPIYNGNARGVFWGLRADHTAADLHRAVLEGIVFSLLHIKSLLPDCSKAQTVRISGGAGKNEILNQLKADLFSLPVHICEPESTPLGTAIIAAVGEHWFSDYNETAAKWIKTRVILPKPQTTEIQKRFHSYLKLSDMMKNYLSQDEKEAHE